MDEKQAKVSLVVVVYNTEPYLHECVRSIKKQAFEGLEAIFVNSGSNESTTRLLKELVSDMEGAVYYEIDNEGGAVAGNFGIRHATGEYVMLMDSDDTLPLGAIRNLYEVAVEHDDDIVAGRYVEYRSGQHFRGRPISYLRGICDYGRIIESVNDLPELLENPFYWGKLYKRSMLFEHDVFMIPGMMHADRYFYAKALKHSRRTEIVPHISYCWRRRTDYEMSEESYSVTSTNQEFEVYQDRALSLEQTISLFKEPGYERAYEYAVKSNIERLLWCMSAAYFYEEGAAEQCVEIIRRYFADAGFDIQTVLQDLMLKPAHKLRLYLVLANRIDDLFDLLRGVHKGVWVSYVRDGKRIARIIYDSLEDIPGCVCETYAAPSPENYLEGIQYDEKNRKLYVSGSFGVAEEHEVRIVGMFFGSRAGFESAYSAGFSTVATPVEAGMRWRNYTFEFDVDKHLLRMRHGEASRQYLYIEYLSNNSMRTKRVYLHEAIEDTEFRIGLNEKIEFRQKGACPTLRVIPDERLLARERVNDLSPDLAVAVRKRVEDILVACCTILERQKITYFIDEHALLGAATEHGLIGHTDFASIHIPEECIGDAVSALRAALPPEFVVQDSLVDDVGSGVVRVVDLRSETWPYGKRDELRYRGVYCELLTFKVMAHGQRNYEKAKRAYDRMVANQNALMAMKTGVARKEAEAQQKSVRAAKLKELKKLEKKARRSKKNVVVGKVRGKTLTRAFDAIFPLQRYRIGNTELLGPNDFDRALTREYGEYQRDPASCVVPLYEDVVMHEEMVTSDGKPVNYSGTLEYVVSEGYPEEDLQRVKDISASMAKTIIGILDAYGIPYMMAHGTLLGAIRHGGFIPWDDDIDISIFDQHYDKALEVLRRELPADQMIVHDKLTDPIYWPTWSKVRDLHSATVSTLWPMDNQFKYTGVCIDLLKTTMLTEGEYEDLHLGVQTRSQASALDLGQWSDDMVATEYVETRMRDACACMAGSAAEHRHPERKLYGNLGTVIECTYDIDDVFPLKKYAFEDFEMWGPRDADAVLTKLYGDYMKLPRLRNRRPHFSSVRFDDWPGERAVRAKEGVNEEGRSRA